MFKTSVTTTTRDKFGAEAEIEKHRVEAAKTVPNPRHVGTSSSSVPDKENPGEHIYTITSTWEEGAPETDQAPEA